jgi:hypothetical protein
MLWNNGTGGEKRHKLPNFMHIIMARKVSLTWIEEVADSFVKM